MFKKIGVGLLLLGAFALGVYLRFIPWQVAIIVLPPIIFVFLFSPLKSAMTIQSAHRAADSLYKPRNGRAL